MRAAVIGHVELIEFVPVEHVPSPGEIVSAGDSWIEAAGGGSVAAVQLSKLADSVLFFTALATDELGRGAKAELEERGIEVHATALEPPQRRGFTFVDEVGERTITTIGPKRGPAGTTTRCPGSSSRPATPSTTARETSTRSLPGAGRASLSRLRVSSGRCSAERSSSTRWSEAARTKRSCTSPAISTLLRGSWSRLRARSAAGRSRAAFTAAPAPVPRADSYGAGDCFVAGLAFALASELETTDALAFAARCGAGALAGAGVHAEHVPL